MKKWLENYWYHYKWPTVIVAFFLFVAVIGVVQMAGRTNNDALFMYVGDDVISDTQYHEITKALKKITPDNSGNGEVEINFSRTVFYPEPSDTIENQANAASSEFLSTMLVQSFYIYLMRADVYEKYKEAFIPLAEVVPELPAASPEFFYDDCAVYLNQTDLAKKNEVFGIFNSAVVLALKTAPYSSSKKVARSEKAAFSQHLSVFRAILAGQN
ncbi:MAG: hypothetical protein KBS76_03550 [Ruminococcus sp.]|nr:hypothetical protein [Candidatus Apopatosoma intestinale]